MKRDWKSTVVNESLEIVDAVRILQKTALQILLVVNDNDELVGVVTDGDIRKVILEGYSLDLPISKLMNNNPVVATSTDTKEEVLTLFKKNLISRIPLLDDKKRITDLYLFENFLNVTTKDNPVVIMAGGLGSRLGSLTENTPKPLLKVGGKPILETILTSCIEQGYRNFYFSVNYRSEMIKNYFGNGENWGVEISYLEENKRLGTAGALNLLNNIDPETPLIVMNGDVLTKVDLNCLARYHKEKDSSATMCVKEFDFQVPYGVVNIKDTQIISLDEKPVHKFLVSAGIYMLSPKVLELIPRDEYFDMTQLFDQVIENKDNVVPFPIHEYWLDIGKVQDYEKAQIEYHQIF